MNNIFDLKVLKNAELLLRLTMIVTTLTAGISKFFSHGGFRDYYMTQFAKDNLRIQLPEILPYIGLSIIPYVEVGLGFLLLIPKTRRFFSVVFVLYFLVLTIGHYILEEFLEVDVVLPLTMIGIAAYMLPAYSSYHEIFAKSKTAV